MPVRGEGEGVSAAGLAWGWAQPVEGVAAQGANARSSLLPSSLSFHFGYRDEREAGVRGSWMLPSANADAPTSTVQCPLLWAPRLSAV